MEARWCHLEKKFIWRPPDNYLAAATYLAAVTYYSGGRHIIISRPPDIQPGFLMRTRVLMGAF